MASRNRYCSVSNLPIGNGTEVAALLVYKWPYSETVYKHVALPLFARYDNEQDCLEDMQMDDAALAFQDFCKSNNNGNDPLTICNNLIECKRNKNEWGLMLVRKDVYEIFAKPCKAIRYYGYLESLDPLILDGLFWPLMKSFQLYITHIDTSINGIEMFYPPSKGYIYLPDKILKPDGSMVDVYFKDIPRYEERLKELCYFFTNAPQVACPIKPTDFCFIQGPQSAEKEAYVYYLKQYLNLLGNEEII